MFISLASPSPSALGRTFATAQTVNSFMSAIGPATVTSMVAASVQYNLLGGSLAYIFMASLAIAMVQLASLLPADVETRGRRRDEYIPVSLPDTLN